MTDTEAFVRSIQRPTLLVNESICRNNIERMSALAQRSGITFRPHFKTHQSASIGTWFRENGVFSITVSSLTMARYFAGHHWKDITVAFPVNLREINEINTLAEKIQLNLLADHPVVIKTLAGQLKHETGIFIEVDTGSHRTGVNWENTDMIDALLETIGKSGILRFRGFLSHTGNIYSASSKNEIIRLHRTATDRMNFLKERYLGSFPDLILSLGDTPSFSLTDTVRNIDEMRPGNFVFYDLMQQQLGACSYEDIAVAVACPVVASYPERNELVVYGGAIHFSKEHLIQEKQKIYGLAVRFTENKWVPLEPAAPLTALSQEHGILHMDNRQIAAFQPGDLIYILPVHSCLTANLMGKYLTTTGKELDHMNGSYEPFHL
ncbi:MAG: alanine racemase [Bacteroidales bacterium]|nr:alanine racemase [Bacteroidales bacterium]